MLQQPSMTHSVLAGAAVSSAALKPALVYGTYREHQSAGQLLRRTPLQRVTAKLLEVLCVVWCLSLIVHWSSMWCKLQGQALVQNASYPEKPGAGL